MAELLTYIGLFLIVFGESTIIVGTFVPGFNALIAASFLASTGRLEVAFVFLAGWLGVYLGDNLGYLIGRYGIDRIPAAQRLLIKIRPEVESFINAHPRLVIFYDFIGFARAPLPVVLGSVEHPPTAWLRLVSTATTLFVATVVGLCYVLGRLVGESFAIKIVIGLQIIIAVATTYIIAKAIYARRQSLATSQK